ncbi:MAG: hypothetical protein ABI170_06875 [Microbacteriaceae bacterium]
MTRQGKNKGANDIGAIPTVIIEELRKSEQRTVEHQGYQEDTGVDPQQGSVGRQKA